jgi:hypothetical protein
MKNVDPTQFIIIGKYYISKTMMMSNPIQLYVTNSETGENKSYYDYKVLELLRKEQLDATPLHEYLNKTNGITKEKNFEFIQAFDEWTERKQMNQEDKI